MNKILISLACFAFLVALSGSVNAATYTVCSSGCNYTSIQAAVNAASNSDTIQVQNGTYTENLDVNKSVNLVGAGYADTTINAADSNDHVFYVTADNVSISGFTVTGATKAWPYYAAGIYLSGVNYSNISNNAASNNYYGIRLSSSSDNTLTDNTASNNDEGIVLDSSSGNTLTDNTLTNNDNGIVLDSSSGNTVENNTANSNSQYGIYLDSSSNNILANNTASSNSWHGIQLYASSDNTLAGNTMSANIVYNFYITGNSISDFVQSIDTTNTVDGKPIYYLVGVSDQVIDSSTNAGYVGVISGTNVTVRDLTLTDNGQGVLFVNTSNSSVLNVTASNNGYGIRLSSSSGNTITNNTNSNGNYGVLLDSSSSNAITNNTASSNSQYGIYFGSSSNNNTISNTASSNNNRGIALDSSSNNTFRNNTLSISGSQYGFRFSTDADLNNDIDATNKVNGASVLVLANVNTPTIVTGNFALPSKVYATNRGLINLYRSSNITIRNVNVSNHQFHGIYLSDSDNNTVANNTASSNGQHGIYFGSSSNNTVTNNTASSNSQHGIYLSSSSGNNLTNNTASSNSQHGIYLSSSSDNTITDNNANSNTNYGIYLSSSSDNTLTYNTASNNDEGIALDSSSGNALTDNTLTNNDNGIVLDSSSGNTLTDNNASSNSQYGIYFAYSSNNILANNTASSNSWHGIRFYDSSNNTLAGNTMSANTVYNFYITGNSVSYFVQSIDTTNTVDGKPIYYLVGVSDQVIDSSTNAGYVGVISGTNVTVRDLTLTNNGQGVLFVNTSNSSVLNVTTSNNGYGIRLSSSSGNTITNNTNSNGNYGVLLDSSSSNAISENNASNNNNYGISISSSSNNNLTNNTASSNSQHGIYLSSSSGNTLTNNNASNNYRGIALYSSSSSNTITENNASNNNYYGIEIYSSSNNTVTNNTASNNYRGIVLDSSSYNTLFDNSVDSGYTGIYIYNSGDITVDGNTLEDNYYQIYSYSSGNVGVLRNNIYGNTGTTDSGVYLYDSEDITVNGNTLEDNYYQIYAYLSNIVDVIGNGIYGNTSITDYAVYFSQVYLSTVTNNTASNNYVGIRLDSSSNNTIYNNLFNNTNNAWDDGTNTWNTTKTAGTNIIGGSYLGGNVWAYPNGTGFSESCTDADGDGICDSSYALASENVDYLPLSLNFTADTTPPSISTPLDTSLPKDGSGSISWTITEANPDTYVIFINGTEVQRGSYANGTPIAVNIDTSTIGDWNYTIWANDTSGNSDQDKVIVTVYPVYGVSLAVDTASRTVVENEAANFTFTVKNAGNVADAITLTVSGTSDVIGLSKNSVSLAAGGTDTIVLTMEAAQSGEYTATVTAKSLGDPSKSSSVMVNLKVTQIPSYGIALSVDNSSRSVEQNEKASYTLTITNTGNQNDVISLTNSAPASVTASLSETSISLTPGSSTNVELNVSSSTAGEDYPVYVTATSQSDANKWQSVETKTTVIDALTFTADSSSKATFQNQNATYTLTINNTGNKAHTYTLSLTSPSGANATLNQSSLTLSRGEMGRVILNVSGSEIGTYVSSVEAADSLESAITKTLSITTKVSTAPVYGVSLSSDVSTQSVNPGEEASYTITLINTGNQDDTYDLTVVNPRAGSALLDGSATATVALSAGAQTPKTLTVSSSASGTYDVKLVAVSQKDPSKTADVVTSTFVKGYGVVLTSKAASATTKEGNATTFTLTVKNTGNAMDSFDLDVANTTEVAILSATTVQGLASGETAPVTLTVSDSTAEVYTATVTATSQGNASKKASATLTIVVQEQDKYEVALSLAQLTRDVERNEEAAYTMTVKNAGNVEDNVTLSEDSPYASLGTSSMTLAPGETRTTSLIVSGTAVKTYNTTVTATSQENASAVSQATVYTNVRRAVEIKAEPASQTAYVGNVSNFVITVTNLGTRAHTYSIALVENTSDTTAELSTYTIPDLEAGKSASVEFTFNSTLNTSRLIEAKIRVSVQGAPYKNASTVVRTLYTDAPVYGVSIDADTSSQSIESGKNATYFLKVKNLGNNNDTVTLTIAEGSSASLSASSVPLNGSGTLGDTAVVQLSHGPSDVGEHVVKVSANSTLKAIVRDIVKVTTRVVGVSGNIIINSEIDDESTVVDSNITLSTIEKSLINRSTVNDSEMGESSIINSTVLSSDLDGVTLENAYVRENKIYYGNITIKGIKYTITAADYPDGMAIAEIVSGTDDLDSNIGGISGGETDVVAEESNVQLKIGNEESYIGGTIVIQRADIPPAGTGDFVTQEVKEIGGYVDLEASENIKDAMNWTIVNVTYSQEKIDQKNIDESTIYIYWHNKSSGEWIPLRGANDPEFVLDAGRDVDNNYVWAKVTRFSVYGIGGSVYGVSGSVYGVAGGVNVPTVLKPAGTTAIRITSNNIGNLIRQLTLMTRQFYITTSELAGVLGALDLMPTTLNLAEATNRGTWKPVQTLKGDPYTITSEHVLAKYSESAEVIISRGDLGVDSIASVAYARALGIPILLVKPGEIPEVTQTTLDELGTSSVIIVGGPVAVSEEVAGRLPDVTRIWGQDRYETAVKIAEELMAREGVDTLVITDGLNPDMMAVAIAAKYNAPIIYAAGNEITSDTRGFLEKRAFKRIVVIGVSEAGRNEITTMTS